METAPATRLRVLDDRDLRSDGRYVLYWMTAFRRPHWNFALQHAAARAAELGKPLLIFEALRCDYRWASDRIHAFVVQGMHDQKEHFEGRDVRYFPYVEPEKGAGKGLLKALADEACLVVADDAPVFFLPDQLRRAVKQCEARFEAVDSNGLYPLSDTDRVFTVAHSFRRHLQKTLPQHLPDQPVRDPLRASLPAPPSVPQAILDRWPEASAALLRAEPEALSELPIDHAVRVTQTRGGFEAAQRRWKHFLSKKLSRYADDRNDPDDDVASGLSPYLHFGHISTHEIFHDLVKRQDWDLGKLGDKAHGKREGWWGMSPEAEAFLDEIVTWREVGYNRCFLTDDYDRYESLPDWALETLADHEGDQRNPTYSLRDLESADTYDELWNAAQRQLVTEGRIHNYLRMLWGKKILEWSKTPKKALEVLIELNNKYALDGRNPNSYSGIFWTLGRYDRAWGPERKIYGKVRYMSSDNTAKKVSVTRYLERYGPESVER
ncbi:MAG: deoxyribodipyrimidine photolyase [Planctomycetota bacterium]